MKKIKLLIIGILLLMSCGLSIAADKPVSQLTAATTIAADDLLMISYYNAGQYYSRKVLFSTLQTDVMAFMAANPLTLGTSQTHDGKIIFRSGTALNDYLFTIQASNFGANLTWTLPTTAPGGSDYLLNLDADGTMGYTDPATFQAKDTDLDIYAGITPSANIQTFLGSADFSAARTNLGLAIGTDVQAYDADLTTYAGITPSANIQTFLGSADFSTARSNLGLAIGTNVQAYNSNLTTYAGITPSANIQSFLGSANYSTARTNLGLAIGTDVQAYDADLTTYAGITPSANIQTLLGSADFSAARTNLGLAIGTNVQAYNSNLTTYAGITPSADIQSFLGSANYSTARTNLGLAIGTHVQAYDADLAKLAAPTAWRIFYSNGSSTLTELVLGEDGTFLKSNGASSAPSFDTPAGSGDLLAGTMGTTGQYCTKNEATKTIDCNTTPSFQAADNDLTTYAGITPSANVQSFLAAANYAAMKTLMGYYTSGDSPTFASVTVSKVSGVAGLMSAYEANSTDTSYIGWMGPASISESVAYQFSSDQPSAGQVMAFGAPTGSGDPNGNKVSAQTWITPATIAGTETLTNKTLDVDGTGNVVKSWGYLILTHPSLCGAGAPMQTTSTARTYGHCKFSNSADKATNYAEYSLVVPPDIDTSVDLVGTFKFILSGADTADHEYEISFDSVADSAAWAGSLGDAVSLGYTADASGAEGDVETAAGTLTGWRSAMTAGQVFIIRVARDGDHATDASTVDSYSGPLVIKYKITQ